MKTLFLVLALGAAASAADLSGVGNFHQINEHLCRGAQPTSEGFQQIAALGVKTVIDLRESGLRAEAEKRIVEGDGMRYINIPFAGLGAPSDQQVSKVLSIFNDSAVGPVFVHCRRGADRTGTVVACYRVSNDHWKNEAALAEAKQNGMAWLEKAMQRYVLRYHPPTDVAGAGAGAATYSSQRSQ
ncbi:MAG: tyrosine-protein phosphatase [Candidatus Sulfopaludibacter sp.]|nr:tyrosine-protein phosphatase [Candidatus Sulfopaludibacter sp.]